MSQSGTASSPLSLCAPPVTLHEDDLQRVCQARHYSPHSFLGKHSVEGNTVFRVLRHGAQSVSIVMADNSRVSLVHQAHGLWVGCCAHSEIADYRICTVYSDGTENVQDDPYRHLPTLGELDEHLIREGRHERLWEALGARIHSVSGPMGQSHGVAFTVWAPNAQAVQVKGDFNGWDGGHHAMRSLGSSGVWELFVPGVESGAHYKFGILTKSGDWVERADPMAKYTEVPPATASRVFHSTYEWSDESWLQQRAERAAHAAPMSIFEVHLESWRQGLSYRELATELTDYVVQHGFTHVEFMPVAEHPFGGSWGYQVTGYYAPTSRFGTPDEFKFLVDSLHHSGIGVIVDWVPAHFPKDEWALAKFDGDCVYEYMDTRRGEHPDWGTLVFNFGRHEVRNFLVANALYWLKEFHIDGLRVDAVASMLYLDYSRNDGEWEPNHLGGREHLEAIDFLQEVNAVCYREAPGAMIIAEESTAWPGVTQATEHGGLGFGFKWNMGWMHDTLKYLQLEPIHRQYHHHEMTFSLVYAWSENYILPISHDEVTHGKGTVASRVKGDHWQQMASARAYYAYMWAHPGKQLLFMGQEFAQKSEWNDHSGVEWEALADPLHAGVSRCVADLNKIYRQSPALWQVDNESDGFQWIESNDHERNVFAFVRRGVDGQELVCVVNFSAVPHVDYELPLPAQGVWQEVLNTDDTVYGGSGVVNHKVEAVQAEHPFFPASATLTVPPLAAVWLTQ